MATSRRQLRRWVGGELGELITGTATQAGDDASTFRDAVTFAIPDTELQGREVWYATAAAASATNRGLLRLVDDNTQSTFSISVVPAWPSVPQTGDVIELYNARGYSITVPEIHEKINQLVEEVSEEGVAATTSASTVLAWNAPFVVAPTDWIWLFGAQYADFWGMWHMIHPVDVEPLTWEDPVVVKINGPSLNQALGQGGTVRLIGAPALAQLTSDDQTTTVDASWLVRQAAAELQRAAALRWGDAATAIALSTGELAEAEKRRPKADGVYPNTGRRWRLR